MALSIKDPEADRLARELAKPSIDVVPVDADQIEVARHAYRQFGKGNHAAGLNFGDCFSYALAQSRGEPLLFKRSDFGKTDVAVVAL